MQISSIIEIKQLYEELDLNHDGILDFYELSVLERKFGHNSTNIRDIMDYIDTDKNGIIE